MNTTATINIFGLDWEVEYHREPAEKSDGTTPASPEEISPHWLTRPGTKIDTNDLPDVSVDEIRDEIRLALSGECRRSPAHRKGWGN